MYKAIIVAVIALVVWFFMAQNKQEKPDDAITRYAENLKRSEEKAQDAADAANLTILKSAINRFKGMEKRWPDSLQELVDKGYINRVKPGYDYNNKTGEVSMK